MKVEKHRCCLSRTVWIADTIICSQTGKSRKHSIQFTSDHKNVLCYHKPILQFSFSITWTVHLTIQWCHVSVIASQITGNTVASSKACSCQQHIIFRIIGPLWGIHFCRLPCHDVIVWFSKTCKSINFNWWLATFRNLGELILGSYAVNWGPWIS